MKKMNGIEKWKRQMKSKKIILSATVGFLLLIIIAFIIIQTDKWAISGCGREQVDLIDNAEDIVKQEDLEPEENEMPYISEMKNPSYELFYGEWQISEVLYIDPLPMRGTEYTDQEVADVKSYYYDNTEIRKIQFTSDEIVIN